MKGFLMGLGILCCIVAVTLSADSQTKFDVGLRVGMNLGTASFDPDVYPISNGTTKTGRTGFMVGGIAQLEFARMFAVEISPTFVLKGGGYQGSDGGTDVAKYSELDFPILFKVIFLQGRFRPYGFAGPNLGIMLSATRSAAPAQGQSQDIDIKSGTSGIDFSLDFGGGCEFEVVKNIGLFLDARYSLGLSNLNSPASPNNQQQAQGQTAPSIKANGFQIMIGSLYHI